MPSISTEVLRRFIEKNRRHPGGYDSDWEVGVDEGKNELLDDLTSLVEAAESGDPSTHRFPFIRDYFKPPAPPERLSPLMYKDQYGTRHFADEIMGVRKKGWFIIAEDEPWKHWGMEER